MSDTQQALTTSTRRVRRSRRRTQAQEKHESYRSREGTKTKAHLEHAGHVAQQIDRLERHVAGLQVRQQVDDVLVVLQLGFVAREQRVPALPPRLVWLRDTPENMAA